ncbi:MAG: 2OG-Fe(II) oxygenase [Amphritea sp.]
MADQSLFEQIANDIYTQGFSVRENALPPALATALAAQVRGLSGESFSRAGIGRQDDHLKTDEIRRDEISWIDDKSAAGVAWQAWTGELQAVMNRRLFLGLFSFESHFAHYAPGDFYKRHLDAFRGQQNRVLTVVTYLNPDWQQEYGGELLIYPEDGAEPMLHVTPDFGTLVVFLSEEFPHEVLPAARDRYSIAGWYRINSSVSDRVDPAS